MTKIEPTVKADWEEMRDGEIDGSGNYENSDAPKPEKTKPQDVRIVYVEMPFWNMVSFMVTAAFAAIPAILIVTFVIMPTVTIISGITGGIK